MILTVNNEKKRVKNIKTFKKDFNVISINNCRVGYYGSLYLYKKLNINTIIKQKYDFVLEN